MLDQAVYVGFEVEKYVKSFLMSLWILPESYRRDLEVCEKAERLGMLLKNCSKGHFQITVDNNL
jgi:hypothetical protein